MLDVLTITLNPAIDQTANIDNFQIDKVNRVSNFQNDPGGKGINVAAYLAVSKLKVGATGFLGVDNPSLFKKLFRDLEIEDKFIYVSGSTRTNVKVVDESNQTVTDINQSGFEIDINRLEKLEKVLFTSKQASWYVFSGSLPSGLGSDIYKRWIEKAHELGIKVALDASFEALKEAISTKPDLIKPNHHELMELVNKELSSIEEYIFEAKELVKKGIELVCISLGKDGALLINKDEVYYSKGKNVKVKTTVGAGDAMLSGLVLGQIKELSLEESLKKGTAFSMNAVETVGPYLSNKEKIKSYYDDIKVKKITN
ncbi:1-phosphofructokinase [Halarcobacter sp.]|uniref:1-phosphofructokinase n=1 Tax=Halarcobacter sp. TaxID=2321133 RepID=UPI002AA6323B|nr:1-phosphofructokinase [Halarcobacter sp.]